MAAKWLAQCTPWLAEDGSLHNRTDTAPPPSKDFCQIFITPTEVIFRRWKIIPPTRADSVQPPVEMKCKYQEFADDDRMIAEITRNLGEIELQYIAELISGHIDYLNRLPRKVLLRILFNLDLPSIAKVAQVSKHFRELCSCDALWSKIYMDHTTQPITNDLLMLVDQKGWKEVFFMNRLQLQMHLRRQAEKNQKGSKFRFAEKFSKTGASK